MRHLFVTVDYPPDLGGMARRHVELCRRLAGDGVIVSTVGASLGLSILTLLYAATGSHSVSIPWLLLLTPISPVILLFVPETARRELEEIAPDQVRSA